MRIGELLISNNYISERDLHAALRIHVIHGDQLGECLVSIGAISEDSLLRVLSGQLGIPYFPSISEMICDESRLLVTKSIASKLKVVPGIDKNVPYILMHEKMENSMSWLQTSGVDAKPALAKKSDIRFAVDAY